MANALYAPGRQDFLEADIDWYVDSIRVTRSTSSYTFSAAHDFRNDISAGEQATAVQTLSPGAAVGDGVADASDITFAAVNDGTTAYLIGYKNVGTAATDPLIFFIDTATGLPVATNGGDLTVQWDNGTNRIFKL